MHKTEVLVKWPVVYLRHMKIVSCHIVRICFIQHMEWQWQQCMHIYHEIILYHCENVFICIRSFSDLCDNFFGEVNLSGFTLFDELYREELQSMPVDERLMSIGVEDLGVIGVLGVTSVVALGVPGKVALWIPGKFVF